MSNLSAVLRPLIRELELAKKAADGLEAKKAAAIEKIEAQYAEKEVAAAQRIASAQENLEIAVRGAHTSADAEVAATDETQSA